MTERDLRILKHIGLYRITLRPVLARLYFNDNESAMANVLKRLKGPGPRKPSNGDASVKKSGLIEIQSGLPGNVSYYQLTKLGTREAGVPEDRSEAFGNQALNLHLAMLWFCCAQRKRRFRVSSEDFPAVPTGDYCVLGEGQKRLLRVYSPAETAKRSSIHRAIAEHVDLLTSHPGTTQAVTDRCVGLAILVHSEGQARELKQAMRSGKGSFGKLHSRVFLVIEVVPSISTLSRMIYELRNGSPV